MAKAITSKKKITKKPAKKRAGSKGGRPLFDGKDEGVIVQKLRAAYTAGANDTVASIRAGISKTALCEYMKKNPEFRNICKELKHIPIAMAAEVQNMLVSQREKKEGVYDEDGNPVEFVPTRDAITASRRAQAALDRRYAANQGDAPPPPSENGGLSDTRKAEIAEAIHNRNQPDPEAYKVD